MRQKMDIPEVIPIHALGIGAHTLLCQDVPEDLVVGM